MFQNKLYKDSLYSQNSQNSQNAQNIQNRNPVFKSDNIKIKMPLQSNKKILDLNQINELTEDTIVNSSPRSKKKRGENSIVISKNDLYMEKVLMYVDNYQKSKKSSPNFEDEFAVLKSDKEKGFHEFEKKFLIPPNYINLKSNEIIEKNKSFKKLDIMNGRVKLFDIFSNDTLDNYNKDRLMANDLDLKEIYYKESNFNPKMRNNNNSFNLNNKHYVLNTSLNNKNLNNSHQIRNNSNRFDKSYDQKNNDSNFMKNFFIKLKQNKYYLYLILFLFLL